MAFLKDDTIDGKPLKSWTTDRLPAFQLVASAFALSQRLDKIALAGRSARPIIGVCTRH